MKKRVPFDSLGGWETTRRRRRHWPWLLAVIALLVLVAWLWSSALNAQWRADASKRLVVASRSAQIQGSDLDGANRFKAFP